MKPVKTSLLYIYIFVSFLWLDRAQRLLAFLSRWLNQQVETNQNQTIVHGKGALNINCNTVDFRQLS